MSWVIYLPISRRALERRHEQLQEDFISLQAGLLWNLASQRLYSQYQDEIAEVERALSQ